MDRLASNQSVLKLLIGSTNSNRILPPEGSRERAVRNPKPQHPTRFYAGTPRAPCKKVPGGPLPFSPRENRRPINRKIIELLASRVLDWKDLGRSEEHTSELQ